MAGGKRWKFQGSTFQVQVGTAAALVLTAISQASPAVVTTAAPPADGTVGIIAAVLGMVELNGLMFVSDNADATTFELAGSDTTAYTAYISGGTFAPATFSAFCELTGMNQEDGAIDQTEVTTICSTAKEFEAGLSDSGTVSLDFNFAPNEPVQAALRAAKVAGTMLAFKVTLPGAGGTILMLGTVQQTSFQGAVGGVWKGTATIRLSGEIFVLAVAP